MGRLDDATNFQRNFSTGQVEVEDGVIYHKTEYRERRDHFAYFACSAPLAGFDTQREDFPRPVPRLGSPAGGGTRQCGNSDGARLGADRLAPGQADAGARRDARDHLRCWATRKTRRTRSSTRPARRRINKRTVKPVHRSRYSNPPAVERAFEELRAYWDGLLGNLQVQTPDEHTNRMVNIWNAYQCMVTFNMSRSASFFESGIGRGMGFRDSNQDLLGFVHMVPERARQRILDLAATQLPTGGAYHQYQPLTKRGNNDVGSQLQRRPALAGAWRRGLSQGNRRSGRFSTSLRPTTTNPAASSRSTTTCSAACATRSTGSARTACR